MSLSRTLRQENGTDGLASAYQRTQVTGTGDAMIADTAGLCYVPVMRIPVVKLLAVGIRAAQQLEPENSLAREMSQNADFTRLVEKGLADLATGRHSRLKDIKQRLGDI